MAVPPNRTLPPFTLLLLCIEIPGRPLLVENCRWLMAEQWLGGTTAVLRAASTAARRRRGAGREDSARAVEAMLASQPVASALRPGITQSSKVGEKHKDKPVEELKEEADASLAQMQSQRGSMDPTSSCPGPNRFGTDESAALGGLGFTYKRRDDGLFRVCKVKSGGFASRSGLMQVFFQCCTNLVFITIGSHSDCTFSTNIQQHG